MNQLPERAFNYQEYKHRAELYSTKTESMIELYENHLKSGCKRLLELNSILLKSERQQRIKRAFCRLAWVGGISIAVLLISYVTIGINVLTVVGLLLAYFGGLLLHDKFSPPVVLPKEEKELYQLNSYLRHQIIEVEQDEKGILFPLLEQYDLEQQARQKGLHLIKGVIDFDQLDGDGLYQYLDGINLLMEKQLRVKEKWVAGKNWEYPAPSIRK